MMKTKNYLNLLSFARIYLFFQLFSMPIIYTFYSDSELFDSLNFLQLEPFTKSSLMISILSYACFYIGGMFSAISIKQDEDALDWSKRWVEIVFWSLFIFGFLFKTGRVVFGTSIIVSSAKISLLSDLMTFFLSLNWFHLLALPFLGICYYENKLVISEPKKRAARYYPLILSLYLINGALNGATAFVIFPLATHLAIHQRYNPLKLKHIACGFIFLFLLLFLKIFIKNIILNDPKSTTQLSSIVWFLIYRVGASHVISSIVESPIFHYDYGIFEQFMYNFNVPGFGYAIPDGNLLGRFYGLIRSIDYATGVAITSTGDFYLNYGTIGVALGMFGLGIFYRAITNFSLSNNKFLLLTYAMLWPLMVHGLESPISVLLSVCIKMILFCMAVYFIIKTVIVMSLSK